MSRLKLYELPAAFAAVERVIDELDGELPEEVEMQLDALEGSLEDVCDGIGCMIRQAEAEALAVGSEIDRLARRKAVASNRAERLKRYLQTHLDEMGRDRVETGRFKFRLQKNGVPSIRWTGDGEIPEGYRKVEVSLDGKLAQAAFKAGELPDGFRVEYGKHLRIV